MKLVGVDSFVRKCAETRNAIPAGTAVGVRRAAFRTKASVLGAARGRGLNPKGWVGYHVVGAGDRTVAVVSLRGARAYWAERGTKGHEIKAKGKALSTPYGPRMSVKVKGARAKPFWHAGVAAAVPHVQAEVGKGVGQALGRVFGGR